MRSILLAALLSAPLVAQDATLNVLHGIPGLGAPVTVAVDGVDQFTFDFPELVEDITLPPATYLVEVKLNGSVVLSANLALAADTNYTAVAHLTPASSTAPQGNALTAFVNNTTGPGRGKSNLTVRHLADAPAVDVVGRRLPRGSQATLFANVSNGQEDSASVAAGVYGVALEAAGSGQVAFGPEAVRLPGLRNRVVYAIGELGMPNFQLVTQNVPVDRTAQPTLVGSTQGMTCGGTIALSTMAPVFDTAFQVTLSGGVADARGVLYYGMSDSRIRLRPLPISLDRRGFTGCTLYQSADFSRPVKLDASGNASVDVTIPARAALFFQEVHFQFGHVDTTAPRDFVFSDFASVVRS